MAIVHSLEWIPAIESYFQGRHDAFPTSIVFWIAPRFLFILFLIPWLCFLVGLLELITGTPFRALAWDWERSRRMKMVGIGVTAGLILVGVLLLVLQFVFHLNVL